jgi:hypothetical protein
LLSWATGNASSGDDERLRSLVLARGQAGVIIQLKSDIDLDRISLNTSVLNVSDGRAEVSLSPVTVGWFINQHIPYIIKEETSIKGLVSAVTLENAYTWEVYPTYTQYDSLMHRFTEEYPQLCTLDTIGASINGKMVLALGISSGLEDATRPEVFYTASMHGDETGGYILMLRLIDHLLSNYGSDNRVNELLDNLRIWINPLANPDGTYNHGDAISSPVRYNARGIDLNRNFPDPGLSGQTLQKENIDMIAFMRKHRFVISANFHSGTEVVNYPWDRWLSVFHADNEWFNTISRAYADTVHRYAPAGYMTDLYNGVTRGALWYVIHGGRQDFVTQELQGREVTIEVDDQYVTPANELATLWESNRRSLLGYLENAMYGVHGRVLDSGTEEPVTARVFIHGYDRDSSQVYSDTLSGSFVRMLNPGIWQLSFSARSYRDTTVNVTVNELVRTDLEVLMVRDTIRHDTILPAPVLYPNPAGTYIQVILREPVAGSVNIRIVALTGQVLLDYDTITEADQSFRIELGALPPGTYHAVFTNTRNLKSCRGRFILIK